MLTRSLALCWLALSVTVPVAGWSEEAGALVEGFVPVESGRLFYQVLGEGEPLVLIHGGQLDRRMWDGQFERYAQKYRVIRYDVRGYGRSPASISTPYSASDDLRALLDHLGAGKAHVAGLSLGGRIASDFAVTYPDRVASLVLIGPGLTGVRYEAEKEGPTFWDFIEAVRDRGPDALADLWMKDPYLAPAAANTALAARLRQLAIENAHSWLNNPLLERTPKPPTSERLAEIRMPTLLILGSRDVPGIQKVIALLEKGIPGAKKVVIEGAGHMVNMEKPEEHDRALLGFLGSLPKGTAGFTRKASAEGYVPAGGGVHLHYRMVGSGSETVVIPWVTLRQLDDLSRLAEGRRLIFYSPRGRLRSDAVDPSTQVSFENELADLEAVRRHFGLEKMSLLGWSQYGLMTAVYAVRHPERVTRVVQLTPAAPRRDPYRGQGDATIRERVDGAAWNALQKRRESGELTGKPAESCRALRRVITPTYLGDPSMAARVSLDDCDLPNEQTEPQQRWWGALFASMGAWDIRDDLRDLRVPRLVVAGEKDFVPLAASREWVAGHPEARLLVLPGVGHFPLAEAPDRLLAAVDSFLDGRWPEGARRRSPARSPPGRSTSRPPAAGTPPAGPAGGRDRSPR